MLVYGLQARLWMSAYAGMTSKRSFRRPRESRSRTRRCRHGKWRNPGPREGRTGV